MNRAEKIEQLLFYMTVSLNPTSSKGYWDEVAKETMKQIPDCERHEFIGYVVSNMPRYEDPGTRQELIDQFLCRMDVGL